MSRHAAPERHSRLEPAIALVAWCLDPDRLHWLWIALCATSLALTTWCLATVLLAAVMQVG